MKKVLRKTFWAVCLMLVCLSCDVFERFVDTEPPTVTDFQINRKTEDILISRDLDTDSALIFSAFFMDNSRMGTYTVSFDPLDEAPEGYLFPPLLDIDTTFDIGGAETKIFRKYRLNSSQVATGDYNVRLNFMDFEGNRGEETSLPVRIENRAPMVLVTSYPTGMDSIAVSRGDTVRFDGIVSDLTGDAQTLTMNLFRRKFNFTTVNPSDFLTFDTLGSIKVAIDTAGGDDLSFTFEASYLFDSLYDENQPINSFMVVVSSRDETSRETIFPLTVGIIEPIAGQ
ncbi:hypothetical protein V6R21_29100 [Limibacter armeniacum]|uniref:hypothetical protein n=1 Tax=Limibacter armeniacum TaxID=466084 RepID=UPI002FE643F7